MKGYTLSSTPGYKALVLDIETSPNLAWVWGMWDQNVGLNQLVDSSSILCFAAKWLGEPKNKVMFYSDYHDGHEDMIAAAWDLINEADAIIHYNGKSFDIKHLNREFLLAGFTPPSPHKDIDLLATARGRFKFPSNKLDYVSQVLDVGKKVEHEGFDLWTGCMAQDPAAWKKMRQYNIGDIAITEAVYYKLLPWIKSHPHVGVFGGREHACPKCNSYDLQKRGVYVAATLRYQQYWCKDCGSWSKGKRSIDNPSDTRSVS